ncbi:hypothetical protein ACKKBG_A27215 [Auxenochlorella protothecoides x Auxenochlorella symbiontica]|uniref:Mediator of RNA polymerase II transcription subunit 21 n=1 Tax=Auxenochlorella protothecoides TaxID=3075 RepID=A0A1D1ZQV2_AUXPR
MVAVGHSATSTDIVTQLQDELCHVTSLLYNFIGTTQRDAAPSSIKDEGPVQAGCAPAPPIDLMAEQLTGALAALGKVIAALPSTLSSEEQQILEITGLQHANVMASQELQASLERAQVVLTESYASHSSLAETLLQDVEGAAQPALL